MWSYVKGHYFRFREMNIVCIKLEYWDCWFPKFWDNRRKMLNLTENLHVSLAISRWKFHSQRVQTQWLLIKVYYYWADWLASRHRPTCQMLDYCMDQHVFQFYLLRENQKLIKLTKLSSSLALLSPIYCPLIYNICSFGTRPHMKVNISAPVVRMFDCGDIHIQNLN